MANATVWLKSPSGLQNRKTINMLTAFIGQAGIVALFGWVLYHIIWGVSTPQDICTPDDDDGMNDCANWHLTSGPDWL